jgi:hypothetical protein
MLLSLSFSANVAARSREIHDGRRVEQEATERTENNNVAAAGLILCFLCYVLVFCSSAGRADFGGCGGKSLPTLLANESASQHEVNE